MPEHSHRTFRLWPPKRRPDLRSRRAFRRGCAPRVARTPADQPEADRAL